MRSAVSDTPPKLIAPAGGSEIQTALAPAAPVPAAAGFVALGLEAALRLRAPRVHAPTPLVRRLAVRICAQLGLDERQQKLVDVCARVRDVGMLGLPDEIVLSSSGLSPEQWQVINRHPVIGADLLADLSGLEATAAVVRAHHERWDGEGYPDGLAGEAIPLLSRVIATADGFTAIASDRPHRRASETDVAREHLDAQRGRQFDPETVDALLAILDGRARRVSAAAGVSLRRRRRRAEPVGSSAPGGATHGLGDALQAVDALPTFAPSYEKAVEATRAGNAGLSQLVGAIEGSTSLTVAVLRAAQRRPGRRGISNVPDAVSALGAEGVAQAIETVPRVPFPWQTPEEELLYHLRVHGQTVARAAQRIATEVGFPQADDLIVAALLHDLGKLVVARARGGSSPLPDESLETPEQRVQEERGELKVDHAGLGAVLIERWGLPGPLATAVREHHTASEPGEMATLLRVADMVARHSHGDAVDRRVMVELAGAGGLSAGALRNVLFDLPQSGSQRRRAEPSPLSRRETDALRELAGGKVYKEIAAALGVSASTVRSHLHSSYAKLGVEDRAQAVLRATEMGWI